MNLNVNCCNFLSFKINLMCLWLSFELAFCVVLIGIEVQKDTWLIDLEAKLFLIGAIFTYTLKVQIFWEGHKYTTLFYKCFQKRQVIFFKFCGLLTISELNFFNRCSVELINFFSLGWMKEANLMLFSANKKTFDYSSFHFTAWFLGNLCFLPRFPTCNSIVKMKQSPFSKDIWNC